jgi:hypothetical protein
LLAPALSSELGRTAVVFDDKDVVCLLKAAVERTGSQRLFAKRYGLDRANPNAVLNGKKRAIGSAAKVLGLRKARLGGKILTSAAFPSTYQRPIIRRGISNKRRTDPGTGRQGAEAEAQN